MNKLQHLKMLAETDYLGACVWGVNNIDSLKSFVDTWGSHCGASKSTFIGQTVRMIIDIEKQLTDNDQGEI